MNRPIRVTIIGIVAIISAVNNGLRLCEASLCWRVLGKYHASPLYLAMSGLTWLIIFSVLVYGIWGNKPWAWAGTIVGIYSFFAWYWVDRLIIEIPHANGPFSLVLTVLLLGISTTILLSNKMKAYFHLMNK
jgi:hypothetical protein